jgi:hypothetical protein
MGMTPEILERRRKYLGASETPVVLGYGTFAGQTPDKVYWDKVGPVVDCGTEATQMGNDFEPALTAWAQRRLGVAFETDPAACFQVMLEGIGKGILSATPDGILLNGTKRWGLEGKAVMAGNPGVAEWGEPESDKIPDSVLIQVHQQAAVWNLELVWVPVLWCIGFRPEFRMYRVVPDRALWSNVMAPKAVAWWNEHVVKRIPPGDEPPSMEVCKALPRKEGLYLPADTATCAAVSAWETCRQNRLDAEKNEDILLREVLSRLGDAEGFTIAGGQLFTYAEQNGQRRVDLAALERDYPDIYRQLVSQSKHRTPRIVGKATAA